MIKKVLLLAIFLFFSALSIANAGEIKFVQLTDTHYSAYNPYSAEVLKAAIKDINNQSNVSFVAFTGDNIDSSKEENLKGFLKIIKGLNVPYYIVIGNHDVFKSNGISKKRYMELIKQNNWFRGSTSPNYVFKRGEFVFIVVDGAKENIPGPGGYYRPKTLEWLDKQLTKYKKKKVVILQHFPVIPPTDSKTHRVYQVETYFNVLNKHDNVIAILSGHYHANKEKMENGVYHINSPSLMAVTNPYKIIDIVTTKGFSPMIYTQIREINYH